MPKAVKPIKVLRTAPFRPLRHIVTRIDVRSSLVKKAIVCNIEHFGGRVDDDLFDEVVTDDIQTLETPVVARIQDNTLQPACVKSVNVQLDEFEHFRQLESSPPQMELDHRRYTFPIRSHAFPPLTRRVNTTLYKPGVSEYEDDTMRDVVAIQYNRSKHAYDDTVIRVQLYKRRDDFLYTVHRLSTSLFNLCHDIPFSHYLVEFPTQEEAETRFDEELKTLRTSHDTVLVAMQPEK